MLRHASTVGATTGVNVQRGEKWKSMIKRTQSPLRGTRYMSVLMGFGGLPSAPGPEGSSDGSAGVPEAAAPSTSPSRGHGAAGEKT